MAKDFNFKKSSLAILKICSAIMAIPFYSCFGSAQDKTSSNFDNKVITAAISQEKRTLPIYGFNGNNSGGPAWNNKGFRDAVVSLEPNLIRYPGGSIANYWDWQNGWFEKTNAITQERLDKKQQKAYVPCGLDQLKIIAEAAHCDVLFVLNMVTRDLNDQLNMLKQAQALGIPVKWVELGNEFFAPQSYSWAKYKTVQDYANTCKQWISAIKEQFPVAKIAVVGGNTQLNSSTQNWNNIVLQTATNADAITFHSYLNFKAITDNSGINYSMLNNKLIQFLNQRGFSKVSNKDIWITEYNIQWMSGDKEGANISSMKSSKINQHFAFTWGQALAVIYLTSEITELSNNVKILTNHNIVGTPVFAAIDNRDSSYRKFPNGIGMQLWLTTSHNMKDMQKIDFIIQNSSQTGVQDYQLTGWKFSNQAESSYLIVNFLNTQTTIDLSKLSLDKNMTYEIYYSDKNKIIDSDSDVQIIKGSIAGNAQKIELPKYSVIVIKH